MIQLEEPTLDCSEEFTNAIGQAINIGTYEKVSLRTPLVNLSKAEVVREGLKLGTPYESNLELL